MENSSRDGNTRPPDLPPEKSVCKSGSNRTSHGTTDWFQIGKGVHQSCILSPCLLNLRAESFSLSLVTKSCSTLATPWTVICQAPLSIGFSRQEYWSGLPFSSPGDLLDPGIKPWSPALQTHSLLIELYIMQNARLDVAQAGIRIARRNINNLRYADDTTLMAESKEE